MKDARIECPLQVFVRKRFQNKRVLRVLLQQQNMDFRNPSPASCLLESATLLLGKFKAADTHTLKETTTALPYHY